MHNVDKEASAAPTVYQVHQSAASQSQAPVNTQWQRVWPLSLFGGRPQPLSAVPGSGTVVTSTDPGIVSAEML
eukprot:2221678-Amphidinium_carterae.1